jgi:hypothetical protein
LKHLIATLTRAMVLPAEEMMLTGMMSISHVSTIYKYIESAFLSIIGFESDIRKKIMCCPLEQVDAIV